MEVINTIGRRKHAVARIYMKAGNGSIIVNKRKFELYFPDPVLQYYATLPLEITKTKDKFDITINLHGGGLTGQSQAISLAIARALCKIDEAFKPPLKAKGLMTRDPRMVERKKPGQRKARKKFQFSKR